MSFTVYRSSAGSGKTFSLVREYLKIVLTHPPGFRHILAITFTHKAANEMKERVMNTLRELSHGTDGNLSGSSRQMQISLKEETGFDEKEISRRATEALSLILHHYSEFSIGTIDSFSHRIIRAFAHDFGLPVSFAVELDAKELLTTAVDLLLEKAGSDEGLTRLLVSFLESRMDDDKGWNIDSLLVEFAVLLLDEESEEKLRKLASLSMEDFHAVSRKLHIRISKIEQEFKELGEKALKLIEDNGLSSGSFYYAKNGIFGYFGYLASGRMDKIDPNKHVKTTLEEGKWAAPKASPNEISAINRIQSGLQSVCLQTSLLKEKQSGSYHLAKLLIKTIYPMAVLNEIGRVLDAFKRQNNLVHISEFNNRIARVVMNEPVPFIYERLGEKFHHLLIDEFQDTSRMQWLNFVPLMENAMAGGYFNLVVGDGKQAIYRWRNGDVLQFTSLPFLPGRDENTLIRQRESLFLQQFSERSLDSNYRSLPEIVHFNNSFFRFLSQYLDQGLQDVYMNLEQKSAFSGTGGYVRLDIIDGKKRELSYSEQTILRIEEIINGVMTGGYGLQDVAILCRTNIHAGRIARELMNRGIGVVSSESLLLSYSPEVNLITGLISFLFNPGNTIIQAAVIHYLFVTGVLKEKKGDFHRLIAGIGRNRDVGGYLFKTLKSNGMDLDKELLLSLPVYDLCEAIIRIAGLDKKVDPYIQFFLDAVINFTEKGTHNASDFLDWWELHKDGLSIVVPEGIDAVRVMTIHKAKGLEFPVVIFPFADEALKPGKKYLWVDVPPEEHTGLKTALLPVEKQMQDTSFADLFLEEQGKSMLDLANVLYVALTRPKDQLYILTAAPPSKMDDLKSLPGFFAAYLQWAGIWTEEKIFYEFGRFAPRQGNPGKQQGEIRTLSVMPAADWRKAIIIRQRAPEYWNIEDPSGRVDFGSRIHAILAGIRVSGDLDEAMKSALLSGMVSGEEEKRIRLMIVGVLTHPALAEYFGPGIVVRNEPGILETRGEEFRPDRVVLNGDEAVVIDYKTGKKSWSHRNQIERYSRLLEEMGWKRVKKFLVYLGESVEVEEVTN